MFLFILIIYSYFFPNNIFAAGEFNVIQHLTYNVDLNGNAKVVQEVNLQNRISQIYAKEYQMNLSHSQVTNLTATDKSGQIPVEITDQKEITKVLLKFPSPVIGKDRINQFYLRYNIPNFAQKKGNTWELQFPVFIDQGSDHQINVTLNLPQSFGDLSFSSVPVNNSHLIGSTNQVKFTQNQLKNKILLVFGNHQLFDFRLLFHLNNPENSRVSMSIPFPPDTNTQTVTYNQIEPPPIEITEDSDGNWLGRYELDPSQDIDITVTGQAKIHPRQSVNFKKLPNNLTSPQPFWDTTNPLITSLAQNLNTPRDIYNHVVSLLNYNYDQIEFSTRKGSVTALTSPSKSLCTEFTDLFVTLARAKGIPAREIEGFAFSNNTKIKPVNTNSDILHAWPEYYNSAQESWIQIDPTWEKTTNGIDYFTDLDLNHFAFVIHGQKSDYPPPPGSYKKDKYTKTVFVDFANKETTKHFFPPTITLENGRITVRNPNLFKLNSSVIERQDIPWQQTLPPLPPLASINLENPTIPFFTSLLPKFAKIQFTIETPDSPNTILTTITNRQHYLNLAIFSGFTIFILSAGGIILTTYRKNNEKNT